MNGSNSRLAGSPQKNPEKSFRVGSRIFTGVTLGFLLVGGAGGWAATAQLTGAVIAQGSVAVDQNLKSIQHRDGGIVSDIAVREGNSVTAGQVLIRLEDAQTKAELSIVHSQLVELAARKARLLAERDLLDKIEFPTELNAGQRQAVESVCGGLDQFNRWLLEGQSPFQLAQGIRCFLQTPPKKVRTGEHQV